MDSRRRFQNLLRPLTRIAVGLAETGDRYAEMMANLLNLRPTGDFIRKRQLIDARQRISSA